MVRIIKTKDRILYSCESCELLYNSKELAKKCEDFCKKYNACDSQITKQAIK